MGGPGSGRHKGGGKAPNSIKLKTNKALNAKIKQYDKLNMPGKPEMSKAQYRDYHAHMSELRKRNK